MNINLDELKEKLSAQHHEQLACVNETIRLANVMGMTGVFNPPSALAQADNPARNPKVEAKVRFADVVRQACLAQKGNFSASDITVWINENYPKEIARHQRSAVATSLLSLLSQKFLAKSSAPDDPGATFFIVQKGNSTQPPDDYETKRRELLGEIKRPTDAATGEPL